MPSKYPNTELLLQQKQKGVIVLSDFTCAVSEVTYIAIGILKSVGPRA